MLFYLVCLIFLYGLFAVLLVFPWFEARLVTALQPYAYLAELINNYNPYAPVYQKIRALLEYYGIEESDEMYHTIWRQLWDQMIRAWVENEQRNLSQIIMDGPLWSN